MVHARPIIHRCRVTCTKCLMPRHTSLPIKRNERYSKVIQSAIYHSETSQDQHRPANNFVFHLPPVPRFFPCFFPPGASWPVSRSKQPKSIKSSSKVLSAGQAGGALAGHRLVMFGLQGSTWHSHGTEVAGSGYSEHKELETSAPSKMRRHFTSRTCTAPRSFDFGPEVQTSQISIHCTTGSICTIVLLCSYAVIQLYNIFGLEFQHIHMDPFLTQKGAL